MICTISRPSSTVTFRYRVKKLSIRKLFHRQKEKRFGFRVSGFGQAHSLHDSPAWLCRNSKLETRNASEFSGSCRPDLRSRFLDLFNRDLAQQLEIAEHLAGAEYD